MDNLQEEINDSRGNSENLTGQIHDQQLNNPHLNRFTKRSNYYPVLFS